MQCLILAGGLATRMRPVTDSIPKALVPVLGKPFAHYQLEWLAKCGVTEVVYSVGYKGQMIRDFVQDGRAWGLQVVYVDEGSDLRGTGGALRLAADQGVLREEFLVTYGDAYLPVDFTKVFKAHQASQAPALMVVFKNEGQWDTSNVCFENGRITLYDKEAKSKPATMKYIDYGISAFRREALLAEIPPSGKVDLAGVFHRLSLEGKLAGFEVTQRFYEVGSPAGLADFETYLASHPI